MATKKHSKRAKAPAAARTAKSLLVRLSETHGPALYQKFFQMERDVETLDAVMQTVHAVLNVRTDEDRAVARTLYSATAHPLVSIQMTMAELRGLLFGDVKEQEDLINA